MRGRAKYLGALGAILITTGCVLPLDIDIDTGRDIRGNGRVVHASRALPAFDAIEANGAIQVVVERTGRERAVVSAEENLLPYLETRVRGGVLYIGPEDGVSLHPTEEVVVYVESFEVVEIRASGVTLVEAEVGWVPGLWITASGASWVSVRGEVDRQHVTVSGASGYDGLDLDSFDADVQASGASTALVWARDRLDAEASGASHVRFRGDPWVSAHVSGASSVTRY